MIYGGLFEPDKKNQRLEELQKEIDNPNFWSDKRNSEKVINEFNGIKNLLDRITTLKKSINNNLEFVSSLKENDDIELQKLVEDESYQILQELELVEVEILLSDKYDSLDAIIEIHPGAGGTESCDWANMLYRMYQRWIAKHNYKIEVLDNQPGEEAGVKSVTFIVHGINAYGYLKNEKGVHRLVRISPFDSNSRRHTSFASVDVMPLFDNNDISIEINPSDLKIDVYHSSGAGGQSVNTTDSAVRITHLPTKTVVTCQNERSQLQNKEKALEILKSKLYKLELEKREEELKKIKGEQTQINFGSQIRSYVMYPYTLVKDHRTNTEVTNVDKVLDGDIDVFINDNLKRR